MTWLLVNASVIGTSHVHSGAACQDSCWAETHLMSNQQPMLSLFVADGAGSAIKGGEGAELAIEAAQEFIGEKVLQGEFGLSDTLAADIVVAVRERLYATAESEKSKPRDYACTFIGVLSTEKGTLVFQVGDGGVVLDTGSGLEVAITPMSGEYANMTYFVTDENAITVLESKTYLDRALKVAAFTDGIQGLGLNLSENTPHEPFFAPFFEGMAKSSIEQEDQLHELLVKFLGSEAVNERTDDDKTLALALWMPNQQS